MRRGIEERSMPTHLPGRLGRLGRLGLVGVYLVAVALDGKARLLLVGNANAVLELVLNGLGEIRGAHRGRGYQLVERYAQKLAVHPAIDGNGAVVTGAHVPRVARQQNEGQR